MRALERLCVCSCVFSELEEVLSSQAIALMVFSLFTVVLNLCGFVYISRKTRARPASLPSHERARVSLSLSLSRTTTGSRVARERGNAFATPKARHTTRPLAFAKAPE